jgi:DNA polymerase-3 subunit gamma/tau
MLLKALEEVAHAPNAMMAAEMAVIRLTHVADLPSPEELVRKLQDAPPPPPPSGGGGGGARPPQGGEMQARGAPAPTHAGPLGPSARGSAQPAMAVATESALARYARFEDVVELIRHHRDVQMLIEVETTLRLVRYSPGRIEFEPTGDARPDMAQRLGQKLQAWTGARWAMSVVSEGGAPTVAETRDAATLALRQEAEAHPLVRAVFAAFPKAKITEIRTEAERAQHAAEEALQEVEDEWDPFEEE